MRWVELQAPTVPQNRSILILNHPFWEVDTDLTLVLINLPWNRKQISCAAGRARRSRPGFILMIVHQWWMVWWIDINSLGLRVNGKLLVDDFPVVLFSPMSPRCDFHEACRNGSALSEICYGLVGLGWERKPMACVQGSSSLGCTPIFRNGHTFFP